MAERAFLMGAKEISLNKKPTTLINPASLYYIDLRQSITPEIYTGYNTARTPLGNPEGFKPDQIVHTQYHLIQISSLALYTFKASGKTILKVWNFKVTQAELHLSIMQSL